MEIITSCCCGQPHELSPKAWAAFLRVTRGLPATVVLRIPGGRAWHVPRIYLALHGIHVADVPELAERYGWERAEDDPELLA